MSDYVKEWMKDGFGAVARFTLAIVFIWACVHKIANPYEFGLQVATYQILPLSLINLQTLILPWMELVVGIFLIAGFMVRASALITIGMNIMFITAISLALAADLQLQCGCFASADAGHEMDSDLIIRDALFIIVGAALVFMRPDRFTLDRLIERKKKHA